MACMVVYMRSHLVYTRCLVAARLVMDMYWLNMRESTVEQQTVEPWEAVRICVELVRERSLTFV